MIQKKAHNIQDFIIYFEKYKEIRIQKNITNADVWNMDKTEFCIKYEVAHYIITIDIEKKQLLSNPKNREFLTTYESIRNKEVEILLILILGNVLILEKKV